MSEDEAVQKSSSLYGVWQANGKCATPTTKGASTPSEESTSVAPTDR
ncbi:MAG: hypothetical protein Q7R67_01335 [bacterium]|nr:hypothetical protein [bacterium]